MHPAEYVDRQANGFRPITTREANDVHVAAGRLHAQRRAAHEHQAAEVLVQGTTAREFDCGNEALLRVPDLLHVVVHRGKHLHEKVFRRVHGFLRMLQRWDQGWRGRSHGHHEWRGNRGSTAGCQGSHVRLHGICRGGVSRQCLGALPPHHAGGSHCRRREHRNGQRGSGRTRRRSRRGWGRSWWGCGHLRRSHGRLGWGRGDCG
mmetsp:Transcript_109344/g.353004  ORF Transcript_109344/g.353004 Transcript_109344/m.353004 type:complete len:205 (-) Transcript_109344:323-937(-)